MSYTNGLVVDTGNDDGVSINDIQKALDSKESEIGKLIRDSDINKWARYKPVRHPYFPVRFNPPAQGSADYADYTAFMQKTGLSVSTMTGSISDVVGFDDIEIVYERPNGGTSTPYRITDFNNYYRYAVNPIEIIWGTVFAEGMYCNVNVYDNSGDADSQYSITFSDIMTEISSSSYSLNNKRICLAICNYSEEPGGNNDPIYYFFSEKYQNRATSTDWQAKLYMPSLEGLLTTGNQYLFIAMIVDSNSYLDDYVDGTDRTHAEVGVSAADAETYLSDITAVCLAFNKGEDRCIKEYVGDSGEGSALSQVSYSFYAPLETERQGNVVDNSLCVKVYLPTILAKKSGTVLNSASAYRLTMQFGQGDSNYLIYAPTDKSGNNYYEISSTTSTGIPEIPVTDWIEIGDVDHSIEDGKHVYEYSFADGQYTITSNTDGRTANEGNGIFLFFDMGTGTFKISFKLQYKEAGSSKVITIQGFNLVVNSSGSGSLFIEDF